MTVLPVHGALPEIVPDSAGRCQRWRHRRHSWTPTTAGGLNPRLYTVEPLEQKTARAYVETHHYARSWPSVSRRYGLYWHGGDQPALVGVATFGIPQQRLVLPNAFPDLPSGASLELNRLVLEGPDHSRAPARAGPERAPANAESWFVAECFRDLARRGVHGVVAFADPVPRRVHGHIVFPGHVGTVYQALSAWLTGRSAARYVIVLPDGTTLGDRAVNKVRNQERGHAYVERRLMVLGARAPRAGEAPAAWLIEALGEVGATRLRHSGCYRYLLGTSKWYRRELRHRIGGDQLLTPPYPKAHAGGIAA